MSSFGMGLRVGGFLLITSVAFLCWRLKNRLLHPCSETNFRSWTFLSGKPVAMLWRSETFLTTSGRRIFGSSYKARVHIFYICCGRRRQCPWKKISYADKFQIEWKDCTYENVHFGDKFEHFGELLVNLTWRQIWCKILSVKKKYKTEVWARR